MLAVTMGAWCVAAGAQQAQPAQPDAPAKPAQEANPFPGENSNAPVIPTDLSAAPAASDAIDYGKVALADAGADPVHSPDDGTPAASSDAGSGGSSSSSAGLDDLIQGPAETERKGRHGRKGDDAEPVKHTGPAEDEQVGAYYLETKNWTGALSRFQSALVLDPENPDVYWGLGEAQRHLGKLAEAKANYRKLVEYDPDSKHGKEAQKLLKEPELANAPAVAATTATPVQPSQP
ncbi:MAG: tetratricopeptide repeat protein [Acidobacteriaceae bacterium]|nr:tetratricopeptide repeat protein [Acidobacteriaceae bacterium]